MEKSLNVGTQSLLGYLPALLIKNILDQKINVIQKLPQYTSINTVSLFADISGFTKLSEAFSKKGRIGPEFLAFSLNRYMEQLINIIGKNGGDIFKFAGDALFVIWPEEKDNIARNCKRAIQCAFEIQKNLHNAKICNGKAPLSIKIGIGVGECKILIVGGFFNRCEYLAIGKAVREACQSESMASGGGETIISQETFDVIKSFVNVLELIPPKDNHYKIDPKSRFYLVTEIIGEKLNIKSETYLIRSRFSIDSVRKNVKYLKQFIPASISLYLDIEKEFWSKEIRMLSIMFLNLEFDMNKSKDEVNQMANDLIIKVQRCVYRTRGGLNKFLMDDKGTLMLLCWGLPPLSNPDDHLRGVLAALSLINDLKKLECNAYMSLTTGTCFTGVCGTLGNRREYSLLGEVVNLSARFMQEAIINGPKVGKKFLFLMDETTKKLIENKISCKYFNKFSPKGFSIQFNTYIPITYEDKLLHKYFLMPYKYNPFPEMKTHKFNPIYMEQIHKETSLNEEHASEVLKDSLFIIDREENLKKFVGLIQNAYKLKEKKLILIKGPTGSGKSLFLRRGFYELLKQDRYFHESIFKTDTKRIVFCTFQTPITIKKPYNGFYKIFREMYQYLYLFFDEKITLKSHQFAKSNLTNSNANLDHQSNKMRNLNDNNSSKLKKNFSEEIINLIIEEKCFNLIKYLELILKRDLLKLFENKFKKAKDESNFINNNESYNEDAISYTPDNFYTFNRTNSSDNENENNLEKNISKAFDYEKEKETLIIPESYDNYFAELKLVNYVHSKKINNFFLRLTLLYQHLILDQDQTNIITNFNFDKDNPNGSFSNPNLNTQEHLFFIIEDCNLLDNLSIEFLKLLISESRVKNISLIYTHQEPLFLNIEDKENKFTRHPEFFNEETVEVFFMNNIITHDKVSRLIKFAILKSHLKNDKVSISKIESALIDIIITKSFKGNPFFIFEITESLLNSKKLIQHLSTEILVTSELLEMEEFKNWCEFKIPIIIEKIVGSIIDSLNLKDMILLKIASIIGNIFDVHSLMEMNEFTNLTYEELYLILKNLENNGILEFLFDKGPKNLICKFCIPFFREILYQRMLIEQKNELHLKVARTLQNPKFRYHPHDVEVKLLNLHLKNSERTLLVQMEEDDSVEESYNRLYRNNVAGGNNLNKWALRADDSESLNITNLKIFLVKDIVQKIKNIEINKNLPLPKKKGNKNKKSKIEKKEFKINDKNVNNNIDDNNVFKSLQQIISGFIDKKSDANITWESRFCVATTNKFLYWYTQDQYHENKICLASFFLANILDITILPDFHIGGRKNIICIYLSCWFKKDESKGPRKFFFSFSTREELYKWTMALNFLRVKAIHDDFTLKFGIMNLPLKHELKAKSKKFLKRKFKLDPILTQNQRGSIDNFSSPKSGEKINIRVGSLEFQLAKNLINNRTSTFNRISNINFNFEEYERNQIRILKNMKNDLKEIFEKTILCFIFCIQNLSLNYDEDNYFLQKNLIKVPDYFYNRLEKKYLLLNSENDNGQNQNNNSLTKINKDNNISNSFNDSTINNSFLENQNNNHNISDNNRKNNRISNKNSNILNSSIEEVVEKSIDKRIENTEKKNLKSLEDEKIKSKIIPNNFEMKKHDFPNLTSEYADNKLQSTALENLPTKILESPKKLEIIKSNDTSKADQLLKHKITQILNKANSSSKKKNEGNYHDILKNVQASSFINKFITSDNDSEELKSSKSLYKRNNFKNDNKSKTKSNQNENNSNKSNETVNFRLNNISRKEENNNFFQSMYNKANIKNDLKNNSSLKKSEDEIDSKNILDSKVINGFSNLIKPQDVFENYKKHEFINNKFFNSSSSLQNRGEKELNSSGRDESLNKSNKSSTIPTTLDYYKMYNIKRTDDFDAYSNFELIDPNLNKSKKMNKNENKKESKWFNDLTQHDNLLNKLKNFIIDMPNDEDIFNDDFNFSNNKRSKSSIKEVKKN